MNAIWTRCYTIKPQLNNIIKSIPHNTLKISTFEVWNQLDRKCLKLRDNCHVELRQFSWLVRHAHLFISGINKTGSVSTKHITTFTNSYSVNRKFNITINQYFLVKPFKWGKYNHKTSFINTKAYAMFTNSIRRPIEWNKLMKQINIFVNCELSSKFIVSKCPIRTSSNALCNPNKTEILRIICEERFSARIQCCQAIEMFVKTKFYMYVSF